jgi:serine/threonine protein kinase
MAVSVERFLHSLDASGLMTSMQASALGSEHAADDGETMASDLVARGVLTEYQAQAICSGKIEHLVLGDYAILDKIGEGGMGQVFKALHKRLDRFAAIKILTGSALHDRKSIDRFYQEVKTAAQITHPNIVITYDASEQNGIHYLVMEYVGGQDLASVLAKHGPLSVSKSIDVITQTAKGLEYAHSKRIVHRDIKPSNLLLDHQDNVKILDMGLARIMAETVPLEKTAAERLTNAGQVMGTLDYMAPEQAENAKQADARSDIYAVGCTLFRLLTNDVPYPAESVVESIMAHREASIPSLRTRCPEAPEWLDDAYRKCVNKRPEDRYQTATELIQDIEGSLKRDDFMASSVEGIRNAMSLLGSFAQSRRKGVSSSATSQKDAVYRGASLEETGRQKLVPDRGHVIQPVATFADMSNQARSWAQRLLHPQSNVPRGGDNGKRLRKHRGTRIVLLAALGLYLSSGPFGLALGLIAAVMGHKDLRKMRDERMDAEGRNATKIGVILGILAVVIAGLRSALGFFGS